MKYIKYDSHMNSTEDIKCFLRQTYAVNIYTQHPENGVEVCSWERPVAYAGWAVHVLCRIWGIDQGWEWGKKKSIQYSNYIFARIQKIGNNWFSSGNSWAVFLFAFYIFSLSSIGYAIAESWTSK